jgi:hypothetical protein
MSKFWTKKLIPTYLYSSFRARLATARQIAEANQRLDSINKTMIDVLPLRRLALSTRCKFQECFSSSSTKAIIEQTTESLQEQGFSVYPHRLVSESTCRSLHERIPKLFAGEFETGVYPDEWHWR